MIKPSKIVLDTNAFYDFCHVLGLQNCGIVTGVNQRVDYHQFKAIIEETLRNKSLFIPATTVFEFVCKLRNDEKNLKNVICFLKEVSRKYSYDIFGYNQYDNYGILFGFDQFSDEYWKQIHTNYEELITLKDKIMLAKIGSESEIMTFFSRTIIHLFILDYFYGKPCYDTVIDSFNRFFLMNPFGDGVYKGIKKSIAHELFEHYNNNQEGKYKKNIFESAIQVSATCLKSFWDFMYESFLKKEKERIRSIEVEFASKESIQSNIYKWFKNEKNLKNLSINLNNLITAIQRRCDFNDCQFAYLENSIISLFTQGTKREKNDAEDYWNLGFVNNDETYLISFELEILEILKQKNINNYNFVCEFYNCE